MNCQGLKITGKKNRDTKRYGGKELYIELIDLANSGMIRKVFMKQ
jgi:hypothetical protein